MATEHPPLIQALLSSACLAHGAANVALHETHGAWVLLAGEHAYKIKKPVQLPFMDFSTLALRRAACLAELTVNRRFEQPPPHPALYTEVLPIGGTEDAPRWGQPDQDDAAAIEYAVHMRRFDDALTLDRLCTQSGLGHPLLSTRHLTDFATDLARIQRDAAVATPDMPFGHPSDVLTQAQANVDALQTLNLPVAVQANLAWLAEWTVRQHQRLAPLMVRRLRDGRVREGHGDLHLGNLALIDGRVQAFDAIEFNDQFRWTDVANDIAFTWMDLIHHGQPGLVSVLLSAWLDATGDAEATDLLPFYAVYRAMVRAKVTGIRWKQLEADMAMELETETGAKTQAEPGAPQTDGLRSDVTPATCLADLQAHIQLARQLAEPAVPELVITHGLSGSGKTWHASRWLAADTTGRAIRLRSDIERNGLTPASPASRTEQAPDATQANTEPASDRYTPSSRDAVYRHMAQRAAHLLEAGWRVLVDATFLLRQQRDAFAGVAQQARCPFHILACQAPPDTLRARILQRQVAGGDASEATLAVLEEQLQTVEPLTLAEQVIQLTLPG